MSALIVEVEKYVYSLLSEKLHSNYVYHNLAHTQRVVQKTIEILESLEISKVDAENLEIAAWFHDVGFTESADNHEEKGVKIASDYLKTHNISEARVQIISELILATKMNSVPKNIFEEILRDADAAHLASKGFFNFNALLRKEW
jgi:predicted metal-dependent HD superfamily phosphohydrolase